jgi:DNA-directed RNA polymerase specialized sigma24 family protein
VPESAEKHASHNRRAREAARRRDLLTLLGISGATIGYAARQLGDGLPPDQARQVAIESAGELEAVASALYRAVRLGPADRARSARLLVGAGMTRREAAIRLGVTERTIRYYLAGGRSAAR